MAPHTFGTQSNVRCLNILQPREKKFRLKSEVVTQAKRRDAGGH
jgi:hypothetical protein